MRMPSTRPYCMGEFTTSGSVVNSLSAAIRFSVKRWPPGFYAIGTKCGIYTRRNMSGRDTEFGRYLHDNGLTLYQALSDLGIVSLADDISRMTSRIAEVEDEFAREFQQLRSEVYSISVKVDDLTARINTVDAKLATLEDDVQAIKITLENIDLEGISEQLSEVLMEITTLRGEFDSASADFNLRLTNVTMDVGSLDSRLNSLQGDVNELDSAIGAFHAALNGVETRVGTLETRISDLQASVLPVVGTGRTDWGFEWYRGINTVGAPNQCFLFQQSPLSNGTTGPRYVLNHQQVSLTNPILWDMNNQVRVLRIDPNSAIFNTSVHTVIYRPLTNNTGFSGQTPVNIGTTCRITLISVQTTVIFDGTIIGIISWPL
ncbi:MAG: hypothetical protein [Apis nora virus 2]|nr:MAG: hypothetical protein [Apis nora virus 2]